MDKKKKIVFWILSGVSFLCALVLFGWGSPFFILAGVVLLPIEKVRELLLEKIRIKMWLSCVLAGVFFTVGVFLSPVTMQEQNNSSSGMDVGHSSALESSCSQEVDNGREESSDVADNQQDSDTAGDSKPVMTMYVLNTDSKKIHYSTCRHVSKISSAKMKIVTIGLDELYKQGYTTCGTCF